MTTEKIETQMPFDLWGWIQENADDLKPPVSNKMIWRDSDMIVMVVGGGNRRSDFHDDPRPEFFYQIKGDMNLRILDAQGSPPRDMTIAEGSVYMLAPHVRHSPQRPDPDSCGIVVEYARDAGELDGFEWYCSNCCELVHRVEVQVAAIDKDLPPLFDAFYSSEDARTCGNCGAVHAVQ
jgi:3-hydroxyanthranilate 3,4-dioxygenase